MSGDTKECVRRKVLKNIGVFGSSLATPLAVSSAKAKSESKKSIQPNRIPERIARRFARARIEHISSREEFSEFDSTGLVEPELFYAVSGSIGRSGSVSKKYIPSVWVYPIQNGGTEVGHIAVSARPESPGVIKSSTARAPQTRLSEDQVPGTGVSLSATNDLQFVFNNPMSFGVEVGASTYVDLKSGHATSIESVMISNVRSENKGQRSDVAEQKLESKKISFEPLDTGEVTDVPNWNGHVCDRNGDWVGCVPVASSMCIGYHENINYTDCDLMWDLHELMGADNEGNTIPYNPAGDAFHSGINKYDSSYDPGYELNGRRNEIMSEIDSGRPCIVGYFGDKNPNAAATKYVKSSGVPSPDMPVGHAETVVGYEQDDNPWWDPSQPPLHVTTHDTYGNVNNLTFKSTSLAFIVLEIET